MEHYPDIMVDIETTSTSPDRGAILQIAAVKFNIYGEEVDPNFFDQCLTIPPSRRWDESTREWWLSDGKRPLLESLIRRGQPYREVLRNFRDWCGTDSRFWCRGLSFDFPFLQSYFTDFEVSNPFKFWQAMDSRTWIEAKGIDRDAFEFVGEKHNAIHDVLHEIKVLTR